MAKLQLSGVALWVLLFAATASVLVLEASAASLSSSRTSTGGSRKSLISRPAHAAVPLRAEMTRREPALLGTTERVAHHVKASHARAELLAARVRLQREGGGIASPNWYSNVTAIPGGYAMSLTLGSPGQTFSVIADTGSDLTWVQAKGCSQCFKQPDTPYDHTKSSSYKTLSCSSGMCSNLGQQSTCTSDTGDCQYTYEYGDQSTTNGDFSTEIITMTTTDGVHQHIPDFAFGVGLDNSVDFAGVDGLLGLGQGPISFPSQLGSDYGNIFSYCLVNWSDSPSQTSPIIFGSSAVPSGPIQYTPLQTSESIIIPTFWFLNLNSVSVNGKAVPVKKSIKGEGIALDLGTVIDSGTTVTFLDPSAYQALTKALSPLIKYPKVSGGNSGLDFCFDTSKDPSPTFPGTTFHFDGGDWVLPQENTFLPIDSKGTWCLAMLGSNQGIQIFGNIQQQNFHVIYDQPNERLGWASAKCDSL